MARHTTEADLAIRKRWSAWLSRFVGDGKCVGVGALARAIYPDSKRPLGRIYDWLEGERTATAPNVFTTGEALRALSVDCSGLLALFAAGYVGDAIGLLATVSRDESEGDRTAFVAKAVRAAYNLERDDTPLPQGSLTSSARAQAARIERRAAFQDVFSIADAPRSTQAWTAWTGVHRRSPNTFEPVLRLMYSNAEAHAVPLAMRWSFLDHISAIYLAEKRGDEVLVPIPMDALTAVVLALEEHYKSKAAAPAE